MSSPSWIATFFVFQESMRFRGEIP